MLITVLARICTCIYIFWNNQTVIYPEHVGYPVAESGIPNYYMLEVHYNNPDALSAVKFETGLELFYTENIREFGQFSSIG
jgi:hypothetical protein